MGSNIHAVTQHAESQYTILLVDANAPLASDETDFVGMHGAEKMNQAGYRFEQMLHEHSLYVPSTMQWCHVGQTTTWSHPRGCKLRRDYVVVTEGFCQMAQHSQVLVDHDTTFAHEDHLPVLLLLQGWIQKVQQRQHIRWDFERMKDPVICQQFQQALLTLPLPTWEVQVDDHCKIYEDQLRQLGRQFFERKGKTRKRPTLTAHTREAIAFKRSCLDFGRRTGAIHDNEFKAQLREIEKQVRKLVCRDTQKFFDDLLEGMDDALGRGDFKELFRTLVRFGSKRVKQQQRGRPLPILKKPDGSFASTFEQQQKIWLQQFAQTEAGTQIDWATLQRLDRHGLGVSAGDHEVEWFPDEMQISRFISRLKRGKAPGPDGLPPDLLKAGNNVIARQLTTLFCKTVAHAKEPLTWKGGYQIPLFKKGSMSDPASYRGIFVSSFVGKLYHASLRAQLLQVWTHSLKHLQMGGRPKCGTDSAHIWLQAHSQWAKFQNLSAAWVFFDLRSAFYTVLRQSLTEDFDDQGMAWNALFRMGVHPAEITAMLKTASADNATRGISKHGTRLLNDLLNNAHFWVKGCDAPVKTGRGTRPGDPTGDILFNLAMAVILQDAVEFVKQGSDATWTGMQEHCADFSITTALPCPAFFDVSYVDDCVFALHGIDNSQVESLAKQVVDGMCLAAKKRGLMVNFDAGKTEMMWRIAGAGSRRIKQQLAEQGQCLRWDGIQGERHIRVVCAYKHLGTWFQQGPRHLKEVRCRSSNARSSWGPLCRTFYAKKGVSHAAKVRVFEALTMSRLLFNAHVWAGVTSEELKLWQNAIKNPLATLCRGRLLGMPPFKLSVEQLAGLLGMLPPMDALHVARLRFLKRLLTQWPQTLWNLLWDARPVENSWVQCCQQSLAWLIQFCPKALPISTDDSLVDWLHAIAIDSCWKGKIQAAARSCRAYRQAIAKQTVWQMRFDCDLATHGVELPPVVEAAPADKWQCDQCPATFATKRGLAMHSHKCHGYRNVVRHFATGDVCQVCLRLYHCRSRLRTHLQTSTLCLNTLAACFQPIAEAEADRLDAEERERTRTLKREGWWSTKAFQPVLQLAGPTLPPPGHEAAHEMFQKQPDAEEQVGHSFQNLQGRLMQVEVPEAPKSWWQTSELPSVVMQSPQGQDVGNGQLDEKGLAALYSKLHLKCLVFVHFFSGYRRSQDLHTILQEISGNAGIKLYVLSVDICMQRRDADLCDDAKARYWIERIKSGQEVIGAGGGPPARPTLQQDSRQGPPPSQKPGTLVRLARFDTEELEASGHRNNTCQVHGGHRLVVVHYRRVRLL